MSRLQTGHVDGVVALAAVDRDGLEVQAGRIEIALRRHDVVAATGIDNDLFDTGEFGDHRVVAGDDNLGACGKVANTGVSSTAHDAVGGVVIEVIRVRVDPVNFLLVIAIDDKGIDGTAAFDNVPADAHAGVVNIPGDGVGSCAGTDDVVSLATEDGVCAGSTNDDVVAVATVERIATNAAKQQVVAGIAVQYIGSARSEQRVVAGPAVERDGARRRGHEIVVSATQIGAAEGPAIEVDEFKDAVGVIEVIGNGDGLVVDGNDKISRTIVAGVEGIDVARLGNDVAG